MSPSTTPTSLLRRLSESPDDEARRRLHELYAPFLHGWLEGQGVPPAEIDAVAREILAGFVRAIPGLDGEDLSVVGASRRLMRDLALRQLAAHQGRRRRADGGEADDPALAWDREHDPTIAHRLMSLLEPEFPADTWKAFRRQVLEGARAAEVAAELGLASNSVLLAKSRVLRRLRQEGRGLVAELD